MKALFNKLIGRTTDSATALALPALSSTAQQAQLQTALEQFTVANHGDRCQTLSFQTSLGAIEWRSAQQYPFTGEWIIRKHTEEPNIAGSAAAVGEPTIKTMTLHNGLKFFQAIAILSEYERGQLAMPAIPTNDADDLGRKHFVAFAEREGIAFDINGVPHPTLDGEVISDGSFTKSALERARAYSRYQSAFFKAGSNDVLSQILSSAPRAETLFEEALDKSEASATLKKFLRTIEDIGILASATLEKTPLKDTDGRFILDVLMGDIEYPIKYPHSNGDELQDKDAAESILQVLKNKKCNSLTHLREILNDLHNDASDYAKILDNNLKHDYFSKGAEAVKLYTDLAIARHRTAPKNAQRGDYSQNLKTVAQNVDTFEARFIKLGGKEDALWRVKSTILDPNAPSIERALNPFILQLNALHNVLEKETLRLRKAVHAGIGSSGPA